MASGSCIQQSWSGGSGSTVVVPLRSPAFSSINFVKRRVSFAYKFLKPHHNVLSDNFISNVFFNFYSVHSLFFHIFPVYWPKVLLPRLPVDVSSMHFSDMEKLNIHAMQLGQCGAMWSPTFKIFQRLNSCSMEWTMPSNYSIHVQATHLFC